MPILQKLFKTFTDEIISISVLLLIFLFFTIILFGVTHFIIAIAFIASSPFIGKYIIDPMTKLIRSARKRILKNG